MELSSKCNSKKVATTKLNNQSWDLFLIQQPITWEVYDSNASSASLMCRKCIVIFSGSGNYDTGSHFILKFRSTSSEHNEQNKTVAGRLFCWNIVRPIIPRHLFNLYFQFAP